MTEPPIPARTGRSRSPTGSVERPVGVAVLDENGILRSTNAAALEMTGATARFIGTPFLELASMREAGLVEPLRQALTAGHPASLRAIRYRTASTGRELVLDIDIAPMLDEHGRVREVILLLYDVTGSPWQEGRAALFYQAFLHSSNAIEITDRAGVLVDVNPAFERIYGWSRDEVIGQKPRVVRSPKTPPEVYRTMWHDLLDTQRGEWSGELVNVDRGGHEHPVLLTISAIRDLQGEITHFIGVATDLSELKMLELQTQRTERLASLGQLAAGVAHELNTPLANIMLIAESIHRRAPNPWVSGRAEAISMQVEAAARIVAGLLDFGRNQPMVTYEADLISVLREALEFVRGKQLADVEISLRHQTIPLPVRVNRVQLIQVFVNIANNAYDAMEGRGRLAVTTRAANGWAEVTFTDSGPGIPPPVLPHIFEPFFTTKIAGKGTGLGLAICHGIVLGHGGEITVRSEPGEGATFTVRIPLAVPSEGPRTPGSEAATS